MSFCQPALISFFSSSSPPDDEDRDIQRERAVDYGKRHQAIDILWTPAKLINVQTFSTTVGIRNDGR